MFKMPKHFHPTRGKDCAFGKITPKVIKTKPAEKRI